MKGYEQVLDTTFNSRWEKELPNGNTVQVQAIEDHNGWQLEAAEFTASGERHAYKHVGVYNSKTAAVEDAKKWMNNNPSGFQQVSRQQAPPGGDPYGEFGGFG